MSVIDEVRATARHHPNSCSLQRALSALSEGESAEFRIIIWDPKHADRKASDYIDARSISEALQRRGHKVSDQAVRRHRNGVCTCGEGPA